MSQKLLYAAGMVAVMALSACGTTQGFVEVPSAVDVARFQPIQVNAADVVVLNAYHPPMTSPNVEHLFTERPAEAARKLVEQQVVAAGAQDTLRVTIENASVTRVALPVKQSLFGVFSRQPAERLEGRMALKFELFDPAAPDIIRGRASVTAARDKTLTNDVSPAEREAAYHALTQDLTDDLAAQMARTIRGTFGRE